MPPARASMPRWLAPFSTSGSISPRPIPTSQPCGSGCLASKPPCACAFAHFCWGRFSRRRTGSRRRSIFTRPKAATCGATSSAHATSCRCHSGVPILSRKTVYSRPAWRWCGSTRRGAKHSAARSFARNSPTAAASTIPPPSATSWRDLSSTPRARSRRLNPMQSKRGCGRKPRRRSGSASSVRRASRPPTANCFWGNDRLESALRWARAAAARG